MFNSPVARRRAFTVLEILVVIGVIILLAGLLLPVVSRVREGGRTKSCNNNLRQLGMAFTEYRRDWSERFPNAGSFRLWENGSHWVSGVNMENIGSFDATPGLIPTGCEANSSTCNKANVEAGAIYPYVKSTEPYICPSNSEGKIKGLSYSMNCAIARMADNRIKTPSEIILLVDEDTGNDGYFFAADTTPGNGKTFLTEVDGSGGGRPSSTDKLTEKHNGGGNLLFVDGHVSFYPFNSFPLDGSAIGLQDKGRVAGTPRFHDISFGKHGSYMPPNPGGNQVDACGIVP